jgi:hypothetical protein
VRRFFSFPLGGVTNGVLNSIAALCPPVACLDGLRGSLARRAEDRDALARFLTSAEWHFMKSRNHEVIAELRTLLVVTVGVAALPVNLARRAIHIELLRCPMLSSPHAKGR